MAQSSGYTIRQLLPERFERMDDAMARAKKGDPQLKAANLPGIALDVAGARATSAVRDALDIDVFELIAKAWAKALELRRAADDAEADPDKTATVFLGEHKLVADLHPVVDVVFGVVGKLSLQFTLEFAATIELAEVTITNHRIVKIGKTEGQASAVLKYGSVELHHPMKSQKLRLTDDLVLDPPLPLGGGHPADAAGGPEGGAHPASQG
jgi:hypothetical protein